MKLLTTRSEIRTVAERWRRQYADYVAGDRAEKDAIGRRLAALDPEKATADDVFAIVGNGSWTELRCNECGQYVATLVELGEPPDYESATASVCTRCLRFALRLAVRVRARGRPGGRAGRTK